MSDAIDAMRHMAEKIVERHPEWVHGSLTFDDSNWVLTTARSDAGGREELDRLITEHVEIPFRIVTASEAIPGLDFPI